MASYGKRNKTVGRTVHDITVRLYFDTAAGVPSIEQTSQAVRRVALDEDAGAPERVEITSQSCRTVRVPVEA